MMLARALEGNELAQKFISGGQYNLSKVVDILTKKMSTYWTFNRAYPGFGGYLPWVKVNENNISLLPEWSTRVPSLDNGEWVWGLYAVAQAAKKLQLRELSLNYKNYFTYLASTSNMIFNNNDGFIRAEAKIINIYANPTKSNYENNIPGYFLDDPYEGELFVMFNELFGRWEGYERTRDLIWTNKMKKVISVNYQTPKGPITVEQGFWFSSHEKWKVLELPYKSIPIYNRIFINGEKARTQNSFLNNIPGLFASTANISIDHVVPNGYVSAVGIQSIASQLVTDHDLITPYGSYPVSIANLTIGLVWYHNILMGGRMQGPYGSTESCNLDGTNIGNIVTWDTKVTSLCGFIGGISSIVQEGLVTDSKLQLFQKRISAQYTNAFPTIYGDGVDYGLPQSPVPQGMSDFTYCRS